MANVPGPLNKQNLSRATIAGTALAVGGIVLFLILYAALGSAGVDSLARVVVALCVPPGLMALLVGGYFLFGRRGKESN
jgi:hypothetical protein